jgi:hypothetical protein
MDENNISFKEQKEMTKKMSNFISIVHNNVHIYDFFYIHFNSEEILALLILMAISK